MKYLVILGDGMADRPLAELGGKTPLEAANIPHMDYLAQHGATGMVTTIPDGMQPGSDIANLSMLGYPPARYYTGRSPLEAVSMDIDLKAEDIALRCNLVTVSDEANFEDKTMIDYSAGEISTAEAEELVAYLQAHLFSKEDADLQLYAGISYRHCLVINQAEPGTRYTPPHDIMSKPVREYLPRGRYGERLLALMKRSAELLKDHPLNRERIARGDNPANACWFWGEGTRPALTPFEELYGVKGGVVCAVDLIKGLGLCAGMRVPHVPGATGAKHTDFAAKGRAALALLKEGCDLVYVHIEAPDESGHAADIPCKVEAIEAIDKHVLGYLMEELTKAGEAYAILLAPDHPTPVALRTHTSEPVPFVLYRSDRVSQPNAAAYTEAEAASTGLFISEGPMLMQKLVSGEF